MGGLVLPRRQTPSSQFPRQGRPQATPEQPASSTQAGASQPVAGLQHAADGGGASNYHAPDGTVWKNKAMYDEYQTRKAAAPLPAAPTAPTTPTPAPAPEPTPAPVAEPIAGGGGLPAAAGTNAPVDSAALAGLQAAVESTPITSIPMADELGLGIGQRIPPQYDNILAQLRRIY